MFNEAWLVNLAIFIPSFAYSCIRCSESMNDSEIDYGSFALFGLFHFFTYACVGY